MSDSMETQTVVVTDGVLPNLRSRKGVHNLDFGAPRKITNSTVMANMCANT